MNFSFYRPMRGILISIVVVAGAFVFSSYLTADTSASHSRPNIIFITADDLDSAFLDVRRPDTGEFAFPNLRSIAEEGVRFENSFVSFSLCCPSRATFLTGQYAHNHGVLSNVPPHGGYQKLNHGNTLPIWLKKAGYYTIHLGKYLNGYRDAVVSGAEPVPPGWDTWFTIFEPKYFFNYDMMTEEGDLIHYGDSAMEYQTDVIARKATRLLTKRSFGSNPFFMVVDFAAPHNGLPDPFPPGCEDPCVNQGVPGSGLTAVPAPRHLGIFQNYIPALASSFNEADVSDKPQFIQGFPLLTQSQAADVEKRAQLRLESLLAVDEGVGIILTVLKRLGLSSNTVIIFTSDNGFEQGEHRIPEGKSLPYEESIRVPLFIQGPGIPKGRIVGGLAVNIDYAPTIVDLAEATPGRTMDGKSLLPLIQNPNIPWREYFLLENPYLSGYSGDDIDYAGIRSKDMKYVEYRYPTAEEDREFYIYTPDQCRPIGDPYELESQHANSCYADLMDELRNRLRTLKNCAGDSCW